MLEDSKWLDYTDPVVHSKEFISLHNRKQLDCLKEGRAIFKIISVKV